MMRFIQAIVACVLLTVAARASDLTVFAAASLTDSLKEIGSNYTQTTGQKVVFNFEASSTLARQIAEGAPADIFFSADEAQMEFLAQKALIDPTTREDLLGNQLVVVVPQNSDLKIDSAHDLDRAGITHLALADPKAVPAGVYAKAWLTRFRVWDAVEPKVVPTENVRGALAAVASGNADAGIVYKTDAGISQRVKVAYEIPAADGPDIRYPVAMVMASEQRKAAEGFLLYLDSDEAAQVFKKFGFINRH